LPGHSQPSDQNDSWKDVKISTQKSQGKKRPDHLKILQHPIKTQQTDSDQKKNEMENLPGDR
jgi:hypothetical protein